MSVLLRGKPRPALRGAGGRVVVVASILAGRLRRPLLTLAGFGGMTAAAWDVSRPLGLLAFGVSCLIIEALGKGSDT